MRRVMKSALLAAVLLAGAVLGAQAPLAPAPPAAPGAGGAPAPAARPVRPDIDPVALEAYVDGWMAHAMPREQVAGAVVSVVRGDGVLLKKGYGVSSLAPLRRVDADRTLFRLGSISKTFTWILLMQQVEAGRIALDQPVNRYLPPPVRVRNQGYARPVLVRHLLDHSAGFEERALGRLFESDPARVRPLELYLRQERPTRVRAPGVAASYSNYGAALAGAAVARMSGKGYEQLAEERIFAPLGLSHTTFREPRAARRGLPAPMSDALRSDIAVGLRPAPAGFEASAYEYIGHVAPAGSASSTAGDMARYMMMLLGDGRLGGVSIFAPATARSFRTPLQAAPPGFNGWAHGFMIYDLPGGRRGFGHPGSTIAFHANMVLIPELDLAVFVATNSDGGERLVRALPWDLTRSFFAPAEDLPAQGSADLVQQRAAFEGHYLSSWRAFSGLEGFILRLTAGQDVRVTPEGRLITSGGEGRRAWVPEGAPGDGLFSRIDGRERLAFRIAGGRAASFRTSANAARFERVGFWLRPATLAGLAALTLAAALATLAGSVMRNHREARENPTQGQAALVQNIQAGLWIAALGSFGLWVLKDSDPGRVMFDWPSPLLLTASASALVAAVLTLATILALPAVWRGGRRVDSWTGVRKAFFTLTVAIYATFSVVLALTGALWPWSA